MKENLGKFEKGKYLIGDISYLFNSENEKAYELKHKIIEIVCEQLQENYNGNFDEICELPKFWTHYTKYGEGILHYENSLFVTDGGQIGIIKIDEKFEKLTKDGIFKNCDELKEFNFENDFEVYFENEDGSFHFGNIIIK